MGYKRNLAREQSYYARNKQSVIDRALRRAKANILFVRAFKGKPCADCGRSYPHYVMHFDHVRGTKAFGLTSVRASKQSRSTLVAEMAKCDLVCANCHAERTFGQRDHKALCLNGRKRPAPSLPSLFPM